MLGELNILDIVNEVKINSILSNSKKNYSIEALDKVILKALEFNGLNLDEVGILLECNDLVGIKKIFDAAKKVKEHIYGNRIVLFLPLYLSNECINDCLYCGFSSNNLELERKTLTFKEIDEEIFSIVSKGHKRILLVAGEGKANAEYIASMMQHIYKIKNNGEIRRINVNMAPLSVSDFKILKNAGIGTYQCFQETYHKKTYSILHTKGPKSNYENRLTVMDRAYAAGIDDVGMGVLFGLYDYKFELLALLSHADYLDKKYGAGPHTLSVPRIEAASCSELSKAPPFKVSDDEFKKIIAVLRLSVPYTGIILSTRESGKMREECFSLGVSQISAESKTTPGGYNTKENNDNGQFITHDARPTNEVMEYLCNTGKIPSFCTACYRVGRTGTSFMALAKPGIIQNFCHANALFTLKEYLEDYADKSFKKVGEDMIKKEIDAIKDKELKLKTLSMLKKIEDGQRDLYI